MWIVFTAFFAANRELELNERQRKVVNHRIWDGFEGKLTSYPNNHPIL